VNLREIILRPVAVAEQARFQSLLQAHHYLGSLPKIGHTLWYVAAWREQWLDRCTIRAGHGPENITRLRRFATGLIKSKGRDSVAATIAKLARNVRRVFDYLRMTENSRPQRLPPVAEVA
jgi:hypothetical protein